MVNDESDQKSEETTKTKKVIKIKKVQGVDEDHSDIEPEYLRPISERNSTETLNKRNISKTTPKKMSKHQQHDSIDDSIGTSKINFDNQQETGLEIIIKKNDEEFRDVSLIMNSDMRVVDSLRKYSLHQTDYLIDGFNSASNQNRSQIVFQKVKACKE